MKRDMDLIRKMVLAMENVPTGYASDHFDFDGYSPEQLSYHAYLIMDAGLATGSDVTTMGSKGPETMLSHLTWAGHEFAETARDESRWEKAMTIVQDKGGSVTMSVLTQLLTTLMKGAFGLP